MIKKREFAKRGTKDFPFAHYDMVRIEGFSPMTNLHWHPEIEMIFMCEGEILVTVSGEQMVLKPDNILFINPGELHSIKPKSFPVRYLVAVFATDLLEFKEDHFFTEKILSPIKDGSLRLPRIIKTQTESFEPIHKTVKNLFFNDIDSKPLVLCDLMNIMCIMAEKNMLAAMDNSALKKQSADMKKCLAYMNEHFDKKITLKELAELIHLTPNYFCNYFKNNVGVTPFEHLNYIRIKKACTLLTETDYCVSDVAQRCGFVNTGFFIRKFKEYKKITPNQYRKSKNGV